MPQERRGSRSSRRTAPRYSGLRPSQCAGPPKAPPRAPPPQGPARQVKGPKMAPVGDWVPAARRGAP
eukprot:13700413-Alexandrium_andersonii.AAC.1